MQERYEMQQLLAQRGYKIGEPDGFIGPQTRLAIRDFQETVGEIPDGFASSEVLDRLRQQ
jgi:peptidoglycan hydrolase-like protein with peptidoglycan-binding domain